MLLVLQFLCLGVSFLTWVSMMSDTSKSGFKKGSQNLFILVSSPGQTVLCLPISLTTCGVLPVSFVHILHPQRCPDSSPLSCPVLQERVQESGCCHGLLVSPSPALLLRTLSPAICTLDHTPQKAVVGFCYLLSLYGLVVSGLTQTEDVKCRVLSKLELGFSLLGSPADVRPWTGGPHVAQGSLHRRPLSPGRGPLLTK